MPTLPLSMSSFQGSGWALAGLLFATLLATYFRYRHQWKKTDSDALTALHKDYGEHINRLQEENIGIRNRFTDLEKEYDKHRRECRKETDELHTLIRDLKKQVDGLMRQIAQDSNSTAMLLYDARKDPE